MPRALLDHFEERTRAKLAPVNLLLTVIVGKIAWLSAIPRSGELDQ